MRRWRALTAGLTGIVLGAGLAIGGATSASAAPAGHWGTFTLSGTSKDYTGTMTLPGFPDTTFTSNSRQSTVISGASTWQGPSTGPGAAYGSSRGNTYINQRPNADSPTAAAASTTTYTFDGPTPGNGSWSFVLGDIDADQATISATVQGGAPATAAQLGYQSSYNSCSAVSAGGWSCPADPGGVPAGQDRPTWNEASRTLTGNAAANDTSGATAWFTPTVPLTSLTITYQQRSGFPVYQTWFANRTAAITGTATLDGTPIPGAVVTVTAPGGQVFTTTTSTSGEYTFPALTPQAGYTVSVTPPPGAETDPASPATRTVDLVDPDGGGVDGTADFRFTSPSGTSSVIGVVTNGQQPIANVPVTITDPSAPGTPIETTTNDAGVYTGSGLPPNTTVEVSVDSGTPVPVRTGDPGTAATPPTIEAPNVAATVSGVVTLDGAPAPAVAVDLLDGSGNVVATVETDADGRYSFTTIDGTYTIRSALPSADAEGSTTSQPVTIVGGGAPQTRDFAFITPEPPTAVTTIATGRVIDTDGQPIADTAVTATPSDSDAGGPVTATTGGDGSYTLYGLNPSTEYTVSVAGSDVSVDFTSGTDEADVTTVADLVIDAATVTPTPTPTPSASAPAAGPGTTPVSSNGSSNTGGALAYTGADLTPGLIAAGVLVLLGAGLLTFRAVRNRRRTSHLQD